MNQQQGQEQGQDQEQPVYLFISQTCQHSRELIQQIQKKPELAKKVQVVAVEQTPRLPPGLTKVPGILVNGQVKMGNDCFEFVDKYGELEASPTYSNTGGFEADSYSYLEGDSGPSGTDSFSFLGAANGSEGVDTGRADNQHNQEMAQKSQNSNVAMSMDTLQQARNQEISQLQGGGPGPSGQRVF